MVRYYVGIDNGKHGAIAVITDKRKIVEVFKYDVKNVLLPYERLMKYKISHAFIEMPIVVHGLAHQTAPFETIGRHKKTLDILRIPYTEGSPLSTAKDNWKYQLGLKAGMKIEEEKQKEGLRAIRTELKELEALIVSSGYTVKNIKASKKTFRCEAEQSMHVKYKALKKAEGSHKDARKDGVKALSIELCLKLFPEALEHIQKPVTKRNPEIRYDDDIAEALLLAECGRRINENQ